MAYREAQNFFWDSASMGGATEAGVSRVDVYVNKRPDINANRSGITAPGATMFIVPTQNTIPVMDNILDAPRARLEFDDLTPTSDASIAAKFVFSPPVVLATDKEYSFIMHYDGDEDYQLWEDVKGQTIIGSSIASTGVAVKDVGKYFTMISPVPYATTNTAPTTSTNNISSGTIANLAIANSSYALNNWRAVSDSALKFTVYAARYAFNGDHNLANYVVNSSPANTVITTTSNSVTNLSTGCVTFTIPATRYEYIVYDLKYSYWRQVFVGERCFHHRPFHGNPFAPDHCAVTINSDIIVAGPGVNFSTIFLLGGVEKEHIICWSNNHLGAGQHQVQVREVLEVISNTSIRVDANCTITNASCNFYLSPVGVIDALQDTLVAGIREPMIVVRDSCANSTNRFTNNCVLDVILNAGGTGYSNTDYIIFNGFEHVVGVVEGGFAAYANLVTNSTGGITGIAISNQGCGFVNTALITFQVANSTGGNSIGTGLSCTCNVGSVIFSEFLGQDGRGGKFQYCRMVNLDLDEAGWVFDIHQPAGCFYSAFHRLVYYTTPHLETFLGRGFFCDDDFDVDIIPIKTLEIHKLRHLMTKRRCMLSWSNEWICCYGANGTICNAAGCSQNSVATVPPGTSNSHVLIINTFANGDFSSIVIQPQTTTTTYRKYIINNDYTNENTNYGNALAKGIETKITFANDHFAEALLVFLTAYRPANTDIQVFARIYNSYDSDAFDDKDWTRLRLIDGANVFSSPTDDSDMVELTYGFQQYPNVAFQLAGSVGLTLNSATVTGVNTTFTSNLAVGSLVHIYQPLFPNNMIVASVNAIANDTSLTLDQLVSNNGLVGNGLIIEKLSYPFQAFNNQLNDNVVRYYNSTMVPFDNFNSYQLKIVLLSNNDLLVPKVDDVRSIGASA